MTRDECSRILVIDDDETVFPLYKLILESRQGHCVDCVRLAGEGLRLSTETMYDLIVCDAKLPYKGAPFGGLILADELARSNGRHGVLVVSQVVDSADVSQYSRELFFLRKPSPDQTVDWFERILPARIKSLLRGQFGFVAMPFSSELETVYSEGVLEGCLRAGFPAKRVDRVAFTKSITAKNVELIRGAHFMVLVATNGNANAFFEAGLAFGLNKHLIIIAPAVDALPFNIRDHRCIPYGDNPNSIAEQLEKLLREMRMSV